MAALPLSYFFGVLIGCSFYYCSRNLFFGRIAHFVSNRTLFLDLWSRPLVLPPPSSLVFSLPSSFPPLSLLAHLFSLPYPTSFFFPPSSLFSLSFSHSHLSHSHLSPPSSPYFLIIPLTPTLPTPTSLIHHHLKLKQPPMTKEQQDTQLRHLQPIRPAYTHTTSPPPLYADSSTSPDVVQVTIYQDPATGKEIVFWEDVLVAFKGALSIRQGARVLPFLRGSDFKMYAVLSLFCFVGGSYYY